MRKFLLSLLVALSAIALPVRSQVQIPPFILNEGTTGTTANKLVKISAAAAIISTAGDSQGAIAICDSGCGTTGFPNLGTGGVDVCVFDNAATAGHWAQISTSVNGDCTDSGSSTVPTSGEIVGRVLQTTGGTGNARVFLQFVQPGTGTGASFPSFSGNTANDCIQIATSGTQQLQDSGAPCPTIPSTANAHTYLGNNTGSTGPANGYVPLGSSDITPNLYCVATGSTNAYVATLTPAATALTQGLLVNFLPNAANTSTAPTINVSSLGAVTIVKQGNLALVPGDLTSTQIATVVYDGTNFQLLNPATIRSMWPCAPQNGTTDTVSSGTSPTETLFATVCKIPANTFVTGRVIHGFAGIDWTATATVPNFTFTMYLCPTSGSLTGCKAVYKSTTTPPTAGTFGAALPFVIQATGGASATATVSDAISSGVGANAPVGRNVLPSTVGNVPTNADLFIQFSATFSTNAATNSLTITNLEFF